jgi:hypothetical protein
MERNHVVLDLETYTALVKRAEEAETYAAKIKGAFSLEKDKYNDRLNLNITKDVAMEIAQNLFMEHPEKKKYKIEVANYEDKFEVDPFHISFKNQSVKEDAVEEPIPEVSIDNTPTF